MATVTIGTLRIDGANGAALEAALRKAGTRYGLLIGGSVGSGKTTAATAYIGNRGFLVKLYESEKVERLLDWRSWLLPDKWVLLDDLGRDAVRNEYGNKCDTVGRFLRELYASWCEGEWTGRLIVTTNLSGAELKAAYDESIVSRLAEMCVPCNFTENHRAPAGSVPPPQPTANRPNPAAAPIPMQDAEREDAFWDRMVARAKKETEIGGLLNIAVMSAVNDGTPDGLWRCAWKVAKNEMRCWSATDCAIVGLAYSGGYGRPSPRHPSDKSPRPFDLPAALHAIVDGHACGEDEDARWFAARTLAWAKKVMGKGPELERAAEARAELYGDAVVDWQAAFAEAKRVRQFQEAHKRQEQFDEAWRAAGCPLPHAVPPLQKSVDFAAIAGGLLA